MPDEVEQAIIDKKLKFYVIDAAKIARENGMGTRTNTVLQTAFFKLSGITLKKADGTVLDPIQVLKDYAEKAYSKKGQEVVEMNWKCIEAASAAIEEVKYPAAPAGKLKMPAAVPADAPEDAVGEAQRRGVHPAVGSRGLHPVRQLPCDLLARCYPHEGLQRRRPRRRSRDVQVRRGEGAHQGLRLEGDDPGRP